MNPPPTELDSFIEAGARKITPRQLHELHGRLDELRESITGLTVPGYPLAEPQLRFLARVVEACALDHERDLSYFALSEAAFAISYFLTDVDIIPDFVGEIGLTDDAAVVALILVRHREEFIRFARAHQIPPETIDP